jgi:hypothetical protein
MSLPRSALRNPPGQQLDLPIGQSGRAGVLRRHPPAQILGSDTLDEFAPGNVSRRKSDVAAQIALSPRFCVQPQLTFSLALIGPVTRITFIRENRPDIAIELDRSGLGRSQRAERET